METCRKEGWGQVEQRYESDCPHGPHCAFGLKREAQKRIAILLRLLGERVSILSMRLNDFIVFDF